MDFISTIGWDVAIAGIGIVLFAGLVRGFTGFGYSAICVALLSFLIEPAWVVPMVLMMEVIASVWMMPSVWRDADFKWLGWTLLGLVIGTPIGIWALSFLPADTVKIILYSGLALLALAGFANERGIIPKLTAPVFVVGIFVGIGNGLAAVAGLIAALFMISADMDGKRVRASMVLLFFFADLYALVWGSGFGLVNWEQVQLLVLFLVPLFLSVSVGSWGFRRYGAGNYKVIALGLIFIIALLGIGRTMIS
ncbi:MAG: sulfite exporter TauE/SafE family protein [Anaerolineae bacterium]